MSVGLSNCVQSFLSVLVEHLKSKGDDLMELSLFRVGSKFKMLGRCFLDSFGARARGPRATKNVTTKNLDNLKGKELISGKKTDSKQ